MATEAILVSAAKSLRWLNTLVENDYYIQFNAQQHKCQISVSCFLCSFVTFVKFTVDNFACTFELRKKAHIFLVLMQPFLFCRLISMQELTKTPPRW
jgi:hypothetical protein